VTLSIPNFLQRNRNPGKFLKIEELPKTWRKTHLPSGVGIPTQLHIFSPNQAMQAALKYHDT
jgi:hypothetical protein